MSNTETYSLTSPAYCRRNLQPGTAAQIHTAVLTSSGNSATATTTTAIYKGLPQQQVSLPTSAPASATACLSKSASCPDSPIRRVSSSLRNSAVGFATRFFNKCRAATFTVDGATYTIVASTPENLPKRDDLSCSGGNNLNTGCHPQQTGSSATNTQPQYLASDKAAFTNTQSAVTAGGGGGGTGTGVGAGATLSPSATGRSGSGGSKQDLTSPSGVDNIPENICSNISFTDNSSASSINGQVARHGALTIVRRSNSRKSFSQQDNQHLFSVVTTPTPASSTHHNLIGDVTAKSSLSQTSYDNRIDDFSHQSTTTLTQVSSAISNRTKICGNNTNNSNTTTTKMLPTSSSSSNNDEAQCDDMESIREDFVSSSASGSTNISSTVDLNTDNLPAVDTPDACDKAALRLRSLLHALNTGEIQADVLQKNLHYAARVLEAVFLDESNQGNKRETKDERCNGDCRNVDCNQHKHATCSSLESAAAISNENNNINTTCSMLGNTTDQSGEESNTQTQNASSNQTSIESRTKGVRTAPQTHSGPTGPPLDENGPPEGDGAHKEATTTITCLSSSQENSQNVSNSSVSSSSCSNKATMQRQKRLRTPVWARSMSTNKTYIILLYNFQLN